MALVINVAYKNSSYTLEAEYKVGVNFPRVQNESLIEKVINDGCRQDESR